MLAAWAWPDGMSARGPSVSSCRCRGVIDITAAMQPWAAITARSASPARGEALMARRPWRRPCRRRARAGAAGSAGDARGRRRPAGTEPGCQQQRIRPQADEQQQRGQGKPCRGEDKGPGQGRQAQGLPDEGAGTDEVGTGDGADGHGPHDDCQGAAAVFRIGEVDGGEAGLQVGGRAEAQQGRGQQQHREVPRHRGHDHQQGSGHGGEQARDEGGAPAAPAGQSGEGQGGRSGAEGHDRGDRPGPGVGAGELDGQQGADGQAGAAAYAAEELRGAQHPNGTALDPLGIQRRTVHCRCVKDFHGPSLAEPCGLLGVAHALA